MRKRMMKKIGFILTISLFFSMGYPTKAEDVQIDTPYVETELNEENLNMTTAQNYVIDAPLLEKSDIAIASGGIYDLSTDSIADTVYGLTQGSILVEYIATGTGQYQSLFSVSNSATGNQDRYFHIYITPSGLLGMELRNTDAVFKYTMAVPSAVKHGEVNKILFKADAANKQYKLFANGNLVGTISKEDFKYFKDITGLNNMSLGGTIRQGNVAYPFGGKIIQLQVYDKPILDEEALSMTQVTPVPIVDGLLIEKNNISIASGTSYDLTTEPNAIYAKQMKEGTIIISFTSSSNNSIQSLLSIGNSTSGNSDRHFHIYSTNTGLLGMELRNTDLIFKYTLNRPASLQGKYQGGLATNTIAFKADALNKQYKLFANGELIGTLQKDDFKFISDITGVNNITLGATLRNNAVAYPFGGTIDSVKVYNTPLSDEELLQITGMTTYGSKIFHTSDGTQSNYYRIPTLLTLSSGTVVSSIDARYGGTHDAKSNIDIAFSKSLDGGVTWSNPILPLVFDDYAPQTIDWPRDLIGKNVQIGGSAAFIDSVLLEDQYTKRLFLFADAFTSGQGFSTAQEGTGFKEINGKKYIKLHWYEDLIGIYNYSIRDNGVIYNDIQNVPTAYSVDGEYKLMLNGQYLTQKQYEIAFEGAILNENKTNKDVKMSVFYKDSLFQMMPTNYLVMKYSDDEGETWSDMKIMGDFKDPSTRMILFGPGVGTQIKNGPYAGRMLISAYNSKSGEFGYLYSDDHGDTWSFMAKNLGSSGNFAEAQIVELPGGVLRTYMRTNVGKIAYITSIDGGTTWTDMAYIPDVTVASYGTQLSAIQSPKLIDGKQAILLSTPTDSSGRRAGKIFVGLIEDTGVVGVDQYTIDWAYEYEVDLPGYGFSYSCMTALPNGDIGILYEKYDSWSRDELHLKNIMRYERYNVEQLR